jgi:hypothetical protein
VLALVLGGLGLPGGVEAANRLAGHPSPYLASHALDPVDWQPWGPEVLARARREGKLVFVSSGYFACHWCHVMQRESFRDPEVAALLNRHFIPVKVDRELLPALDAQLIRFVRYTSGQAGWPLSVVLTPAGHPLFGTTYRPREDLLGVLRRLQARWSEDAADLSALAEAATGELFEAAREPAALQPGDARRIAEGLVRAALRAGDALEGGFGEQSKFPASPQLLALIEVQARGPDPELARFLRLTLDQMARLGLHDALGGGFFRYTADPRWQTPHFEKMLHDNALLAEVYGRAAEVLGEPAYREVAHETLGFLLTGMGDPDGGFVSSLSAVDAEGVEGGYYLWSEADLGRILTPEELSVARAVWDLQGRPPFDAGHLPMAVRAPAQVARDLGLDQATVEARRDAARQKLLAARAARVIPRDRKQVAAWNGLALETLARALGREDDGRYRRAAARLAELLRTRFWSGEGLARSLVHGRPVGQAALEDYAGVAAGLLAWAEVAGDGAARAHAGRLVAEGWRRFRDGHGWRLGEAGELPFGGAEAMLADGALPSPSALLLRVSRDLARAGGDPQPSRRALSVLARAYPGLTESPLLHASHIALLEW